MSPVLRSLAASNSEWARQVVLFLLVAEALAAAGHGGPPHRPWGVARSQGGARGRRPHRETFAGRRPRG